MSGGRDSWLDAPATPDEFYAVFREQIANPKHPHHAQYSAEFKALCEASAGRGVVGPGGAVFEPSNPLTRGVTLAKP